MAQDFEFIQKVEQGEKIIKGLVKNKQPNPDFSHFEKAEKELNAWIDDLLGLPMTGEKFRAEINSPLKRKQKEYASFIISNVLFQIEILNLIRFNEHQLKIKQKFYSNLYENFNEKYSAYLEEAFLAQVIAKKDLDAFLEKLKKEGAVDLFDFLKTLTYQQGLDYLYHMERMAIRHFIEEFHFDLIENRIPGVLKEPGLSAEYIKKLLDFQEAERKIYHDLDLLLENEERMIILLPLYIQLNEAQKEEVKTNIKKENTLQACERYNEIAFERHQVNIEAIEKSQEAIENKHVNLIEAHADYHGEKPPIKPELLVRVTDEQIEDITQRVRNNALSQNDLVKENTAVRIAKNLEEVEFEDKNLEAAVKTIKSKLNSISDPEAKRNIEDLLEKIAFFCAKTEGNIKEKENILNIIKNIQSSFTLPNLIQKRLSTITVQIQEQINLKPKNPTSSPK